MKNCAVVGIQWGDEGKGRMVDYLASQFGVVVRYQGGNNAGHTVINERGKFALNLLPSGIFQRTVMNLLGVGMVVDVKHLMGEISAMRKAGVAISPENLAISDRATIVMPFHPEEDALEEARLGTKQFGSTRRGIAPAYGDRALKKAVRFSELFHPESLKAHIEDYVAWKNARTFASPIRVEDVMAYIETYAMPLIPYIVDAGALLDRAASSGKKILFEAQLGALRDLDYGIYPYTSSSTPLAAYAPIGGGLPSLKLDRVVGVMKAYSTCVGEGPFVGELQGDEATRLREAGAEYGAATGRPRRVAWFDAVAARYGVRVQGATEIALTKLDVLTGYKTLKIAVKYVQGGQETDAFPDTDTLFHLSPVYEELPGWDEDISGIRTFSDLPICAQRYIRRIEALTDCRITCISVGAERDQLILREDA